MIDVTCGGHRITIHSDAIGDYNRSWLRFILAILAHSYRPMS
jgi:hypothetical protein